MRTTQTDCNAEATRYLDQQINELTNGLHYMWTDFLQVVKLAEEHGLNGHLATVLAQRLSPVVQKRAAIDALKEARGRILDEEI